MNRFWDIKIGKDNIKSFLLDELLHLLANYLFLYSSWQINSTRCVLFFRKKNLDTTEKLMKMKTMRMKTRMKVGLTRALRSLSVKNHTEMSINF